MCGWHEHFVDKYCSVVAVTVLSRTLWIGHISKQTTEEELQQELNKHGEATVMVRALSLMCSSSSCNNMQNSS